MDPNNQYQYSIFRLPISVINPINLLYYLYNFIIEIMINSSDMIIKYKSEHLYRRLYFYNIQWVTFSNLMG